MGYKCPKCGYERQPEDLAPDYECPKCGVIYEKAKKTLNEQDKKQEQPKFKKKKPKLSGQKISGLSYWKIWKEKLKNLYSVAFSQIKEKMTGIWHKLKQKVTENSARPQLANGFNAVIKNKYFFSFVAILLIFGISLFLFLGKNYSISGSLTLIDGNYSAKRQKK